MIPDELLSAMELYDAVCFLTMTDDEAAVLIKVPTDELTGSYFRRAPIAYRFELALYPEGPVLCLVLEILDDLTAPYLLEALLNVAQQEDVVIVERVIGQPVLPLHFYDSDLNYRFTRTLAFSREQREELRELVRDANRHLQETANVDWHAARQRFMREVDRPGLTDVACARELPAVA